MSMAKDLGFILSSCQNREHSANGSSVSTLAMPPLIPLLSNNKPMATDNNEAFKGCTHIQIATLP